MEILTRFAMIVDKTEARNQKAAARYISNINNSFKFNNYQELSAL